MKLDKKTQYEEKYNKIVLAPSPYFTKQFEYIIKNYSSFTEKTVRILDLGGGTGEYSLLLQNTGYDVTLFDFSKEAVKKAQDIGVKNTICADFKTYEFNDYKFDIILSKGFSLLNTEKNKEFEAVLAKSKTWLSKKGILIYWGQTNLTGVWTKSGWYQLSSKNLRCYFNNSLILPAFRYQLFLPHFINLLLSKTLLHLKKLPKTITLIGVMK